MGFILKILRRDLKEKVLEVLAGLSEKGRGSYSIRSFCLEHDINYVALFNSFKNNSISLATLDAIKKAVPDLNMNWFLYGEGEVFTTGLPQFESNTDNQ